MDLVSQQQGTSSGFTLIDHVFNITGLQKKLYGAGQFFNLQTKDY